MKNWISSLITLTLLYSFSSFSETSDVDQLSEKEMALQDKARKRLYPGGRDEEELVVNPEAVEARRKVSKSEIEREVYKQLFNEDMKPSENSSEEDISVDDED